ncbi:lipopolysaccharide biosynthesis protein [Devosia nitrariae]|uniref:Lipopolysaccharide biosynthesis protein n=1 Tax=Devosia nitrariae TaxID=2071872 RepID=A0ABQ5W0Y3_9HYPH|nr:lipopolysaccharide biosynthesis protein [Devosia nitrariae]GLQ53652.1 lipopolysaccharide biosynthesis protein [Devosia nitrariae]
MDGEVSLRTLASHGVKWSIIQNWGGKVFTFLLTIILARLLAPADFGTASAVALIILIVPMISELGFGDAIMQRRDLKPSDLNLPFMISAATVSVLFVAVILTADSISAYLRIPGQSVYVIVASGVLLMTAPSMFQQAMYKRHLKFKSLALRTFLANIVGGTAAVICAWMGFGIWSFVVQSYVAGLISVVWLWWRPQWVPGLSIDGKAFLQMTRFGIPVVAQRLVDFAGTRVIDIIIISQLGLAAYGLYAIGSRIYLTMMQLLQGAFYDVSLTVLSTIAHDRQRMAETYLKTIGLAATYISPIFVLVAAVAPEVSHVLLGDKWVGVEGVIAPLLLLGALQCVQFINGPFLSAMGRPDLILLAGTAKSSITIIVLLSINSSNAAELVIYFAACQLSSTPIVVYSLCHMLRVTFLDIVYHVRGGTIACASALGSTVIFREYAMNTTTDFAYGLAVGVVFITTYVSVLFILNRDAFLDAIRIARSKFPFRKRTL